MECTVVMGTALGTVLCGMGPGLSTIHVHVLLCGMGPGLSTIHVHVLLWGMGPGLCTIHVHVLLCGMGPGLSTIHVHVLLCGMGPGLCTIHVHVLLCGMGPGLSTIHVHVLLCIMQTDSVVCSFVQIWFQNSQCFGNETTIYQCQHGAWGLAPSCTHDQDVSVVCTRESCVQCTCSVSMYLCRY